MSTRLLAAAALAALLALAASARAQTGPGKPEEKVPPGEREARVRRSIDQMKSLSAQVDKLAAQARSEKDIVKLNCVNEKLNQVRGLLKVSEQAEADLREANARREDEQSMHLFSKVGIAGKKVSQLRQDAEQCIGQLAFYNDEKTKVDVEVPAGLPSDDPTNAAVASSVISRPAPASGF
jgi:TolA-binding protein